MIRKLFDYVANYFNLRKALEQLFGRKVDLIEYGDNLNPIFKALVDKKKRLIFEGSLAGVGNFY